MKIAIGSDHAGYSMKLELVAHLKSQGHQVDDVGPYDDQRVDYPDFARKVGENVVKGLAQRGVLVCGSGIGMAMAANKVPGCRAITIHNCWEAEFSRRHNNANVACFGGRSMGPEVVKGALDVFLATEFEGGRHADRVAKISRLDGSAPPDIPGE
ncbi:MAG: ribose 5-phosphate isomerase B [Planctomycetes bacterium]|nr:ribose 5-phosphate isomerase B [Planctomycetota bacterium]